MADVLYNPGRVMAMNGIKTDFAKLQLVTSAGATVGNRLTPATNHTEVNQTTGELTNNTALPFTINEADITKTATAIQFLDASDNGIMQVDLDTTLTINYAGEATIAAGDLKVTL